ncbi:hypothetical protein PRIPAC_71531 [Pristionchus pacificus]|uniref:Transmembrane ion channel n=1 Tax=Pristionchus pacificus TaxID=54126 RepID=A0A2A6BRB7_PRIPA|nr:hypothetical protein PRIPAC_71531 [Pristionchus pacificus]|eukprot:PDM68445.1 transmembrane ion channel [Pristionchus pacificus]
MKHLDQQQIIAEDDRLAEVLADGTVFTTNPSVYDTWCRLNLNNFPFDSQECEVNIGSWVYTANETQITTNQSEIKLDGAGTLYEGNSEWEVTRIRAEIKASVEQGENFQEVWYYITLHRRASYYVFVLLVPTFIVTTLCIIGLFTPLDNFGNRSERIGEDRNFRLHDRIAVYVLAEIIVCCIGVLITIAIQMAHQRVNTRLLLPPSQKMRDKFPHSKPDKMGMRVLVTADGNRERSSIVDEIQRTLTEINEFLDRTKRRDEFLLYWVKVFDRFDVIFLVILQIANIILTIIALTVNF